jgi:hypothetical protein
LALLVEESAHIRAAPETIWKYLSEPQSWRFWWPNCKQAETADRRPLHDGSSFELTLDLGPFTVTQRPTVEMAQPNRALMWVARSMGVTRRHAFYIEPGKNGVTVRERCTFEGWGMPLFRFLGLQQRSSEMFRGNLRGLRKMAERS